MDTGLIKKEPQVIFENSFQNVKKFAEILYKCKLCTSLPSILTSEDSFLLHVNNTHLLDNEALKKCPSCKLKFRTKEDLWAHRKLMHSDFASEDDNSSENDDEYEIAWQITTDHADMNSVDSYSKRKKGRKDKNSRRQKKVKNVEEVEQDPHIVIAHGLENTMSPSSANNQENLLKLTNQITADASPTGSHGNNLTPSSTPEFGKYTKLIREGGNIVYFCHVCNWKSQMKVLFTEHCNSASHLVKVTIADQNDGCQGDDPKDSSVVEKYGKKGHFMSFLDEKINYYINKRLSNESMTGDQGEEQSTGTNEEGTNDGTTSEDTVLIEVKKEHEEISEGHGDRMEMKSNTLLGDSNQQSRTNRRKRKVTSRFKNEQENEDDWSDDSDGGQQPTMSKMSRQYIEIPKQSDKVDVDSQFKIQMSSSRFSPLRTILNDKSKSFKSEIDDQSKSSQQNPDARPEKESPKFVAEEQDNKDSEKTQNQDSEKPGTDNTKQEVSDAISKAVESELYRSSMYMYRCSLCAYVCNDITEYRIHFETEHEPEQNDNTNETTGYMDCKTEQWKVQRIRELLPEILVAHPRGNVSRDLLLQKVSVMVNEPEISNWGPACNKALRELYPDSLAQRKGKFKKTYFFGVALIEQVQQEQEASQSTGDGNEVDFSPLRDMTQDMDRILQHLHKTDYKISPHDESIDSSTTSIVHVDGQEDSKDTHIVTEFKDQEMCRLENTNSNNDNVEFVEQDMYICTNTNKSMGTVTTPLKKGLKDTDNTEFVDQKMYILENTIADSMNETKKKKETNYSCEQCLFQTKYRYCLQRHKYIKHDVPTSLQIYKKDRKETFCDQCGKVFQTNRGVRLHIKMEHQHLPQYKCGICSKGFMSNTSYTAHMDKHAGRKQKCLKCGSLFSCTFSLNRHSKNCCRRDQCHVDNIDQSYECETCRAVLVSRQALKDHIRALHDNVSYYSCPVCYKTFKWRSSLSKHTRKCKLNL